MSESPPQFGGPGDQLAGPGVYNVLVCAHDPANGNTGVDRTTFIVQGE